MVDLTGHVLGDRYRVEDFLGRGGMADVYKVRDLQRAVFLAMKVLHSNLARDQIFWRRFEREARTLEMLQHPNIVRFYGLEKASRQSFILMDYIDGLTLSKELFLYKNPFPSARVLQIAGPVCAALYFAHNMGMVHCDIKPGNIMIHRNGTVFLTDFGIARLQKSTTQPLTGAGTPAYMAPEQFDAKESSPATDIYALGVVLFEMLTGGKRPYTGDEAGISGPQDEKIAWEKRHLPIPSPRKIIPQVSAEMQAVVMRCLNTDPQQRFSTALDLLHALEKAADGSALNDEAETRIDLPPKAAQAARAAHSHATSAAEAKKEKQSHGSAAPEPAPPPPEKPAAEAGKTRSSAEKVERASGPSPLAKEKPIGLGISLPPDSAPAEAKKPAARRPLQSRSLHKHISQPAAGDAPGEKPPRPPGKWRRPNTWWMILFAGLGLAMFGLALFYGRPPAAKPTSNPAITGQAGMAGISTAPSPATTLPAAAALTAAAAGANPAQTGLPAPGELPTAATAPEGATAAAVAAAPSATTAAMAAGPSPLLGGGGRVAFASDRSGSLQIWVMDPGDPDNPNKRQQITSAPDGACQPTWSPDATQIAFTTPCKGPSVFYPGSTIKIIRLADKTVTDLAVKTPGIAGAFDPAWSPDGLVLAYTAILGDKAEIRAINLNNKQVSTLTSQGRRNSQPAWSPDGKHIAYIFSDSDKNWDALWSMTPAGESQEPLARSERFSEPAWSPDGAYLLASVNKGDNIPLLALVGSSRPTQQAALLLPETYRMSHASFSPDGQWIVFWTDQAHGKPEIMLASVDGKQVRQLTHNNMSDFQPAWSPK